jgi:regulator of protease activity HflC (stomatin/prohibitin superfamily)
MKAQITGIAAVVLVGFLAWFVWEWGFCRFYVEPSEMAILTAKAGKPLPPGQILAEPGQKGIQAQVLGEGRHFRNPILFDHEIVPVVVVPAGKVAVVTAKVGDDLPEGEFLADAGQKGILRGALGPGKYRLNPYGYKIDTSNAISIPIGYVGVATSLSGEQAPSGEFAAAGQKGIRKDILQPGLYFVNPKQFQVDVLEIGVNQVSLLGKGGGQVITKQQLATQNVAMDELQRQVIAEQKEKRMDYIQQRAKDMPGSSAFQQPAAPEASKPGKLEKALTPPDASAVLTLTQMVEFPSRDGFEISLDMTVEFELLPENIAWIYRSYGDLPAVVEKILMPQILSVSRLKGSAYRAKDFIVGEGREKFQTDLTETLAKTLGEKKIVVHNALIRHVNVPMQILDPIQQAGIAVEQDLTNVELQNTAKKQAELNTETSLIEQRGQQVAQETEKLKAEIKADQEKQVAEINAEALKQVAEIDKQTAMVRAERTRKLGGADAKVITMVEGERAKGFQLKAGAFKDPAAYSLYEFADRLNPSIKINILHAGDGTLWTDLEKATLGELGGAKVIGGK